MTVKFKFLSEKYWVIRSQNLNNPQHIVAENLNHLKYIVEKEIKLKGNECDLNHIDVSNVTDMSHLFDRIEFNGDISKWDVSKVENMSYMFSHSNFNGNISNWNVSNVKDMSNIFKGCPFNGDISNWDVSKIEDMSYMFFSCNFNGDISNWNISSLEKMRQPFVDAEFNQDISNWKPYKLNIYPNMFDITKCPIPYWFEYKDTENRKKVIDAYHLEKELNQELGENSQLDRKIKI
jgi:hypothetical protein